MKLTKYQHACVVVEIDGTIIVIDPGAFSHDFIMPKRVDAVVITHEHPDHFDRGLVDKILKSNPKATLIAHESISGQFTNHPVIAPSLGQTYSIGSASLQFFGGLHAQIADTVPVPANFGVLVNEMFYYPGDSFVAPGATKVKVLALPVSAPWLKISETLAFLAQISPEVAFPTHDGILSEDGKTSVDRLVGTAATGKGILYTRLDGSSIVIA